MRILWICIGLATGVAAMLWGLNATRRDAFSENTRKTGNIEVVLLARTSSVRAGESIVLWLAVYNVAGKPVWIDGQVAWPGNVFLWVQRPGSRGESGAETWRPQIGPPSRADLIRVQPGHFYGRELVVGPRSGTPLVADLRKLHPGSYIFRAVYYSPGAQDLGAEEVEISSNRVTVEVQPPR